MSFDQAERAGRSIPIPADFAQYSRDKCWRELCPHYGISRSTLTIWRRETAVSQGRRLPWLPEEDRYLRDHYGTSSMDGVAGHLGRTINSVKARARVLGIQSPQPSRSRHWNISPRSRVTPFASGHSGEAAYLQRFGSIYRCHADGTPTPIGAHWYWAGNVLTHDEMEAKARAHRERKALLAA
ncbi:MAG: hypothetical protein WA940_00315 [Sphingopyxis sp.]